MPLLAALAIAGCGHAMRAPAPAIHFEALWWSDAQQANFDPNNPPPKLTLVTLQKWEYSDPVGVPHPDEVDGVIQFDDDQSRPPKAVLEWRGEPSVTRPVSVKLVGPNRYVAKIDFTQPEGYSSVTLRITDATGISTSATLPIITGD